jgi:predicted DCC family thiol-disulfide oxidoreductase YuxK
VGAVRAVSEPAKTTVYFNSACPVCRSGVAWQQGQASCGIEWVDVHNTPEAVAEVGADIEAVRERLYVRDANGRVHIGADAAAALFRQTPGQRWLGRLVALPLIRPAMRSAYDAFARALYRWNRSKRRW